MLRRILTNAACVASLLLPGGAAATEDAAGRFVDVGRAIPGVVVDMRYLGSNNFVGAPIDGYQSNACLLTQEAAAALALAQADLKAQGFGLKIFDCYRPARAVAHFVRWAKAIDDVKRKAEFYPDVDKRDLFAQGYIAEQSGHSRGSTVDLTLVRLDDASGPDVEMGTPFDYFGTRSWPADASVGDRIRANRMRLADAMTRRGFKPYDKEWWHFTLAREPFPDTYFDFPVATDGAAK